MAELLGASDVLIGMHGAGWTNALLLKPGASAMQLMPYGYCCAMEPIGRPIRGTAYRSLVLAGGGLYSQWTNQRRRYAYMRRHDFWSIKQQG